MSVRHALSAVLLAAPLAALTSTAASAGPPAVCEPIHTRSELAMPWGGDGWNEVDRQVSPDAAVKHAVALLAESKDTFEHMETLRRTVVYVSGYGKGLGKTKRKDLARELVAALQGRLKTLEAELRTNPALADATALARFDVGYAAGALSQVGIDTDVKFVALLERALEARTDDPAMRVGVGLACWTSKGDGELAHTQLLLAAEHASSDPVLERNLLAIGRHFLETTDLEGFREEIRRRLEHT